MSSAANPSGPNGEPNAGQSTNYRTALRNEVIVTDKVKVRIADSDKKIINQYEFEQCLGKGQHGSVWVARDVRNSEKVVRRSACAA